MLVDSYREDPQAHCAAQGDAVGDVGRTPAKGVSWATSKDVKARCQQLVCRHALKPFTRPAREYLTQYSAVRWET